MLLQADIAVIGGGAAGFAAGITAARCLPRGRQVVIIERDDRVLKKVLKTGNGRCNLTNLDLDLCYYNGQQIERARSIFARYDVKQTLAFFESIGLFTRVENGRVYPRGEQAAAVVDLLRAEAEELGIRTLCDCTVNKIKPTENGFLVQSENQTIHTKFVVLTTGSSASLRGGEQGYGLLRDLGHHIVTPAPALVQLCVADPSLTKPLKGVKVKAIAGVNGRKEQGEVLFTEYGLSGIGVMNLSRHCKSGDIFFLDLIPDQTKEEIVDLLRRLCADHPDRAAEHLLSGLLQKRLGQHVIKLAVGISLQTKLHVIREAQLELIAAMLKHFALPIQKTRGMAEAQVCSGGVPLAEIDPQTMQSCMVPQLFLAGEVLDVDGQCGGYNLQWAWSSGQLAGRSAAMAVKA